MLDNFHQWMEEALSEAEKGARQGEVPVGAVLTDPDGQILARAHNRPISLNDPTAHAEILTLRQAAHIYQNYRLPGMTLTVTIEPCLMCMGAAIHARIARLIYGAHDKKFGAAGSLYNIAADIRLNHRLEIISGIREKDCSDMIQSFFKTRRLSQKGEVPKWS